MEGIILNEMSDKDRYCFISLICEIKKYSKLFNIAKRSRLTDIENKPVVLPVGRGSLEEQYEGRGIRVTNY